MATNNNPDSSTPASFTSGIPALPSSPAETRSYEDISLPLHSDMPSPEHSDESSSVWSSPTSTASSGAPAGENETHEDEGYDEGLEGRHEEHDDAHDVMNLPASYVAPSHHLHRTTTPDETEDIKQRRQELEAKIEEDRIQHQTMPILPSGGNGWSQFANIISNDDKALVKKAEEEFKRMGGATFRPELRETYKDQKGRSQQTVHQRVGGAALQVSEPQHKQDKTSSSRSDELVSTAAVGIPLPISPPSGALDSIPNLSTLPQVNQQASRSSRVSFDPIPAVADTPFTKTLRYFKSLKKPKNKENSPSKSRRNASLPEEIAKLAKEANEGEFGDSEDLEAIGDDIRKAVEVIVHEDDAEDNGPDVRMGENRGDGHPVFIKVISMIPLVIFWFVMNPLARYVDKAYEMLVEKLAGLSVQGEFKEGKKESG